MRMRYALAGLAVALATTAATAAQSQATITGLVLSDATGDPIPNARVAVTPAVQGAPVVLTDSNGRFSISIPAGQAKVVASKSGYARKEAIPTPGQPVEFRLSRGAVIAGRIIDEFSDPVFNAQVRIETPSPGPALPLGPTTPRPLAVTSTNDRGEYRLTGLPAGTFAVDVLRANVSVEGGQPRTSLYPIFYPGTTAPDRATALRLQAGEERDDIDFVVPVDRQALLPFVALARLSQQDAPPRTPQATGIVRGRVASDDGRPVPHARVRLLTRTDIMQSQAALAGDAGRLEFSGIPKGALIVGALQDGCAMTAASEQ